MKKIHILFFIFILFHTSCADKKSNIDEQSSDIITVEVSNNDTKDYVRFIIKSHQGETTFDVPANNKEIKKIPAEVGTVFSIRATKGTENVAVKITDNKKRVVLNVNSILFYNNGSATLLNHSFLIFDPADNVEDPTTYKVGFAKDALWLENKTFIIEKRYYEDNGEDNLMGSPVCTVDDEFTFTIDKTSSNYFSPDFAGGKLIINQRLNKCLPEWPDIVPEEKRVPWSIFGSDKIFWFVLFNPDATYASRYSRIIQFQLDFINKTEGTITFHAGGSNGYRKEVFVYKLKQP